MDTTSRSHPLPNPTPSWKILDNGLQLTQCHRGQKSSDSSSCSIMSGALSDLLYEKSWQMIQEILAWCRHLEIGLNEVVTALWMRSTASNKRNGFHSVDRADWSRKCLREFEPLPVIVLASRPMHRPQVLLRKTRRGRECKRLSGVNKNKVKRIYIGLLQSDAEHWVYGKHGLL